MREFISGFLSTALDQKREHFPPHIGPLGEIVDYRKGTIALPQHATNPVSASILHAWLTRELPYAPTRAVLATVMPYFHDNIYDSWSVTYPDFQPDVRGIVHMPLTELERQVSRTVRRMQPEERAGFAERLRHLTENHERWQKEFEQGNWRNK